MLSKILHFLSERSEKKYCDVKSLRRVRPLEGQKAMSSDSPTPCLTSVSITLHNQVSIQTYFILMNCKLNKFEKLLRRKIQACKV